jgi:hypothetical protein
MPQVPADGADFVAMTVQPGGLCLRSTGRCVPNQAPTVFVIFIAAQLLDGGLTYWGVYQLGLAIEGNAWLGTTMQAFGAAPALVGAKTLACLCGLILYLTARYRALAVTAGVSIGVAVVPWLLLLGVVAIHRGGQQ